MSVLVLNSGSSSLKFALIEPDTGAASFEGLADRLGTEKASLTVQCSGERSSVALPDADPPRVLAEIFGRLTQAALDKDIEGIGHRVVHGGEDFAESALITEGVEASIAAASRRAPLHNPANLMGIRAAQKTFPGVPQVAVFDTAFHQTLEAPAFRYAVPEPWYREYGVRKYGFHGTSYRFVAEEAAQRIGRPLADLQLLAAHLGNGCSACAIKGGKSVDTSMGLTPLAGLVMGTRSGDIDPSIIAYMADRLQTNADGVTGELNTHSGLSGLSGLSNDMRALLAARGQGHSGAALAVDVFCRRLSSCLLGLSASLDRVDGLVFTAGIGENAFPIRAEVATRLWALGARVDPESNARHGTPTGLISCPDSLPIWVIATNEEWMIARDTRRLAKTARLR